MPEPLLSVEITRGERVESQHAVHAIVTDADGRTIAAWGDPDRPTFPRSANKPLQALPLIETGAADRFQVSPREIAFSCASHIGEPFHVAAAAAWLTRIGLSGDALECGAHFPYDEAHAHQMIREGITPSGLHNNCSGKHSGMLCHAVQCGDDPKGYIRFDHPVQQRVARAVNQICGIEGDPGYGIDGCGIPTFAIPLRKLAMGMARLSDTSRLSADRAAAASRIVAAMAAFPEMVSGTGEFVTCAMQIAGEKAVVKSGAEGVFTGSLRAQGFGFALKVEDGAGRAAEVAAAALLTRFAGLDEAEQTKLDAFCAPKIRNRAGLVVGDMQAAFTRTARF